MKSNLIPRRSFLKNTPWLALLPLGAQAATPAAPRKPAGVAPLSLTAAATGLTYNQVGAQIWIRWGHQLVTSYRAHRSQKMPYLYPCAGPASGLSLTAESSLPWPHHRSMFFGCDRVNGFDYWSQDLSRGLILSEGPVITLAQADRIEIQDRCEWTQPDGTVPMRDERKITVRIAGEKLRLVDWEIRWIAVRDVQVQKTNHSLFALRAAPDITPANGGHLVNAEGAEGEKATFGKPSAWCGYYGARPGSQAVEGIALLDHPKNPWSPAPWFTRDYGFISPTPLNFRNDGLKLAAGEELILRYRVALHAGTAEEAKVAGLFGAWEKGEGI